MNRMPRRLLSIALLSIAWVAAGAVAQPTGTAVYRCGPDGREYSATPCANGKSLNPDDPRSPGQQHQAQEAARREAALADQLARERRTREKAALPAQAIRIGPAASAPSRAASAPKKGKSRKQKSTTEDPELSPPMRAATGSRK